MSRLKGVGVKAAKDVAAVPKKGLGVDGFGNTVSRGERRRPESKGPRTIAEALAAREAREKSGTGPAAPPPSAALAGDASDEARRRFTRIDAFEGVFACLHPDTPCVALWRGRAFPSASHALLAAQYPRASEDVQEAGSLRDARAAAQGEQEVEDWARERLKAAERIQRDKFRRSAEFRKQLQDTGDRDLVWENNDDSYFGVIRGKGQNQLGRILMDIRTSIQKEQEFDLWLVLCCEVENEAIKRPPVELVEQKGGPDGEKHLHRLTDAATFKLGKIPANAVQALHPSVSREHAMILHTRDSVGRQSGGVAIMDLGSKAGTSINGRKIEHSFMMEPLKNGDSFKLGASTRDYAVKVNLRNQIELLEQQQRELLREVEAIDKDASDPIEAAKRAAKDEATCFVGGLDAEVEKADLLGLFQDCGHIQEVRFPGAPTAGKGGEKGGEQAAKTTAVRGIAFVVFDNAHSARRACGLSGELFKGKKIRVAPAADGPKGQKGKGGEGKGEGKSKSKQPDRADKEGETTSRELRAGMERAAAERARRSPRKRSRSRTRRRSASRQRQGRRRSGSSGGRSRQGAGRDRRRPDESPERPRGKRQASESPVRPRGKRQASSGASSSPSSSEERRKR